jgi:hypothetical protein
MEIALNDAAEAACKLAKLCPPNNAPPTPRIAADRRRATAAPWFGARPRSGFHLLGAIGHCSAELMDMARAVQIIHADEH